MENIQSDIHFSKKSDYITEYVGGRGDKDDDIDTINSQIQTIKNNSVLGKNIKNLDYDEYKGYLVQNGLFNPNEKNNMRKYTKIEYEHIDSSSRNINNSNYTLEPVMLQENTLTFSSITIDNITYDNYLWINDSTTLTKSDKINFTGFLPVETIIRSILKSDTDNNIIFTDSSQYVKILINPNIVNSVYNTAFQNKIDMYDFSNVTVTISGFKGSSTGSKYFFNIPIAVLNNTFQIYLDNPENSVKPWDGTYFYIKLPFAYSNPGNIKPNIDKYNISFLFNHMCGVPNYFINADYPLTSSNQIGYHIIEIVKSDKFAVILPKEWLGNNNNNSFGNKQMYYSKITSINVGYPNPNEYVIELTKEYKRLKSMKIINTVFPASENVFTNNGRLTNTYLYWQNLNDGDIVYNINISGGTYTTDTLKTEIESKILKVPRIVEEEYDYYDKNNYMTVDFNTDNNITTFKSFRKYIFTSAPIIDMSDSPSLELGTYTLTISQTMHNLAVNDNILFSGMIDHMGIPAASLNNNFVVNEVIDSNTYKIIVSGVNINESTVTNNTGGGFNVTGFIDNSFRLLFTNSNTMGKNIGFRNVGTDTSITQYNTVIKNTDPYFNESEIDQNGNKIDYLSGRINLNRSPYFFMCCSELKNKILQNKNNERTINDIICKINCSKIKNGYYYDTFTYSPIYFYEPINLNRMNFMYFTPEGNLVDFGNFNHSFMIEFEYACDKPEDTFIDSTTGIKY